MIKPRQKRVNHETIRASWAAFGELKAEALKSGRVNDCSLTKVAAKVGLSKAYFTGNKASKNDHFNQSFKELGSAIAKFRDDFKHSNSINKQKDIIKELQEENKNLLASFHKYFSKVQAATDTVNRLKQRIQMLDSTNLSLQNELHDLQLLHESATTNGVISIKRSSKVVIDTHSYRLRDMHGHLRLEDAYFDAFDKLANEMSKPYKKRLYVTVGLPGAGKTSWIDSFQFPSDRHSIIFDALNLTRKDRRSIYQRVANISDLEIVWVAFLPDFELINDRNRELDRSSQQLSDQEIQFFFDSYEFPEAMNETWIKDIKICRGLNDY